MAIETGLVYKSNKENYTTLLFNTKEDCIKFHVYGFELQVDFHVVNFNINTKLLALSPLVSIPSGLISSYVIMHVLLDSGMIGWMKFGTDKDLDPNWLFVPVT